MKLNYKRTFLIGLAFMSICAFWQFYDQVIPYLFENTFGVSTFWTNAIMSIDNVLALVMLPLFGSLSDRVKSPLGKRSPFILAGTAVAVVAMSVMAFAEQGHHFWSFFTALVVLLFAMSTYRSPAVALMPDLTPKPLRSKGNAVINLMGAVGGIYALGMMMVLIRKATDAEGNSVYAAGQSFVPVFLAVAAFMAVAVTVLLMTVRENKLRATMEPDEPPATVDGKAAPLSKPVLRSLILILLSVALWYMAYNAVTTAFSRYCEAVMGAGLGSSSGYLLAATVVATASYLPLGILSGRLGRKKTILGGVILMTACYAAAFFITVPTAVMYGLFALVGIGWAAINVNSFPMVVEMSHAGNVGKYTGLYYTFSMAAQITTPLLSGLFIDTLGLGYRVLFPYAVIFSALSFVTMLFVKHGDVKPEQKASLLEHFDAGED